MDATGSMGGLISKAKNSVNEMFERAGIILKEHGKDPDQMLIKMAIYRSYNSPLNQLIEQSPWESKPQTLRSNFLDRVSAHSGLSAEEAVECGLQLANYEAEHCGDIPLA